MNRQQIIEKANKASKKNWERFVSKKINLKKYSSIGKIIGDWYALNIYKLNSV